MTDERRGYDFTTTLGDLDGGKFLRKLNDAVAEVVQGVTGEARKREGKVTIELTFKPLGDDGSQLQITHKVTSNAPYRTGKVVTHDETATALYVGRNGLTILPDTQESLFNDDKEVSRV